MKNRDRYILQKNEYDLLIEMQKNIIDGGCCCIIDALTGSTYPCENDKVCMLDTCRECIQRWLNAETI